MEHFKKLVFEFQEIQKARNVPSALYMEEEISLGNETNNVLRKKTLKGKGKSSKCVNTERNLKEEVTRLSADQISFVSLANTDKFKGKLKDRIYIRKQILNQLYSFEDKTGAYDSIMEEFITLEENLFEEFL